MKLDTTHRHFSNRKKSAFVVLLLCTLCLLNVRCDKMLDIDSSHMINESNSWSTINDARSSMMGVYGLLRSALAENNNYWLYGELRMGDFVSLNKRELEVIIDNDLASSYPLVVEASNWKRLYAVINAANTFIEHSGEIVEKDLQYTQINNDIDIAQMRAVRGFCYFLLARTWGDVPLWTQSYEGSFPKLTQTDVSKVLTYAANELKAAEKLLPYRYGDEYDPIYPTKLYHGRSVGQWDGALFTKLSANAILAHIAAWTGNYLEASVYTEFIMSNASKGLATYSTTDVLTKADGLFYNSKPAQIVGLGFAWDHLEASYSGHFEQLTLASPLVSKSLPEVFVSADQVVAIFDQSNDERFHIDAKGNTVSSYFSDFGGIRPIFSKIKVIREGVSGSDGSLPLFSSSIVFTRLEEIALLRAEALAILGETSTSAILLDELRSKRGLAPYDRNNDLIDEIFNERRRELMGEGWRWFDLVRYHKIKREDTDFLNLIENKGIYWPVSNSAMLANPNLIQNPYWQ